MLAQKGQNVEARLARAIAHKIPIPNFPLPMRQDPRQRFQPRLHDSFHSDYLSRRITPTRKEKSRPVQRISQSKLLTSKPNLLPFPFSSHSLTLSSIVKRPDSPPTIFSDTLLFLGTWTLLPPHCSSSSIAHSPFPPLPPLSLFPAPIHSSLSLEQRVQVPSLSLPLFPCCLRPSALDSRLGNKFSRADTEQYFLAVCTRQFLFLPGAPGTRG